MKNIILMRHGRYVREEGGDPSLSQDGIAEIFDLSRNLKAIYDIDAVYYSPATRTKETALIVTAVTGAKESISYPWLYEHDRCATNLREFEDSLNTVCIVTHSPNLDEIMNFLCKPKDFEAYVNRKTLTHYGLMGKAITMEFQIDGWSSLEYKIDYELNYIAGEIYPEEYKDIKQKIYGLEIKHLQDSA